MVRYAANRWAGVGPSDVPKADFTALTAPCPADACEHRLLWDYYVNE